MEKLRQEDRNKLSRILYNNWDNVFGYLVGSSKDEDDVQYNETSKFYSDIDIIRNRYIVDGKSAIGIFTLDLSKPVDVEIHTDDEYEIKRFNEVMEEFVISES